MAERSHRTDVAAVPGCGGVDFLGDSLTYMARRVAVSDRGGASYGIGGERSADLPTQLGRVVSIQPTKLFLLIGAHDLAGGFSIVDRCPAPHYRRGDDSGAEPPSPASDGCATICPLPHRIPHSEPA